MFESMWRRVLRSRMARTRGTLGDAGRGSKRPRVYRERERKYSESVDIVREGVSGSPGVSLGPGSVFL